MGEIVKRKKLGGASSFPGRRGAWLQNAGSRKVVTEYQRAQLTLPSFFENTHPQNSDWRYGRYCSSYPRLAAEAWQSL